MAGSCQKDFDKFQERLWPILALQFVLAVAGNGFAIYRFLARGRSSWHTGIVYAFNLAVSDLLYAFSLLPLAIYYYPEKDWRYGLTFCKLDRFLFFYGRLEPRHAKLLSVGVWSLVAAISAPVLSFSTTERKNGTNQTECLGSAAADQLGQYRPYSLFLLAFGCMLPFLLTVSSCGAILYTVLRNQNITAAEKRKVKALVGAVVALYALSYLPFHMLRNLNLWTRMEKKVDCGASHVIYTLYQLSKIVVHFHICIHPLLYASLADNLQGYCCRAFRRRKEGGENDVPLRPRDQDTPGEPQNQS
ncbi:PREDICTED: P2Y purinoceptor 11 [Gekko japonicus]|uniref:P2Y purinoceptor 11 n=1 Tax=Gekko japonicus TaxID=146911 RepID=A0ABM1KUA2_GEKJA|nr:PREDICTED: P2Y purinoceptor 11 [Gekko japonicus]